MATTQHCTNRRKKFDSYFDRGCLCLSRILRLFLKILWQEHSMTKTRWLIDKMIILVKWRKSTKDQEMKNKTSIDGIDIWDTEAGRAVSALQLPVVIWWWWWWWRWWYWCWWRWYVMTNIFAVKLEPTSLRFVLPVPPQCWKASIW